MGEMPKVNIYDPTPPGVNVATGAVMPERPRRVSVAWGRDTHVQVGVGWVDPNAQPAKDNPGWSADFIVDGETDERMRVWLSQWCDMDRRTINQLIRELRRARDQAFGRDE